MKKFLRRYKKEVLFFCPSIEEGGVEKNLINITNGLSDEFKISILTANKNKQKYFKKRINFLSPKTNFFNNLNRIYKSLICCFILINYSFKSNFIIFSFQSNILAIFLAKILNKRVIIRSNSSPNIYAKNKLKRSLFKFFFKYSDKIIVNSKEFKIEFKKFFNLRSVAIYNLMENNKTIRKLSNQKINFPFFEKNKKSLKILAVGRLVDQKDHMTILKALNIIKFQKKFKFCIIGKGHLKQKLQYYIKINGLNKNVKLLGYKKNVYPYYKKTNLFILSSKFEGLPNSLLEAISLNKSIISSNCKTGPREILENYNNSMIFKVGDYQKLSQMILKFKLKKKNIYKSDKRFDFNSNLNEYKKIIISIIK